jgi:PncC family amidohydrolase
VADETAVRLLYLLRDRKETLATAESLTGGLLGQLVTAVPGSSSYYRGGVITYATDVKESVLRVSPDTVAQHGVVSAECAVEMAVGVRDLVEATWAVSTTGVAGPDRQEGKPVGVVYVGVAGPSGATADELRIEGDRGQIRLGACQEAMRVLIQTVNRWQPDTVGEPG